MNGEVELLEKHLKKSSLISNVVSITIATITAIGIGTGFYYSTKATLQRHEVDLKEIKKDVNDTKLQVNEIQVFRGVSSKEIEQLEKKVDKMDEKLDKILLQTQDR